MTSSALVFPCETEITNDFPDHPPDGPLTAGNEKDAANQTADDLPLYRFDLLRHLAIPRRQVISFSSHRTGEITAPGPVQARAFKATPITYPDRMT